MAVSIEHAGKTYYGIYTISQDMITVSNGEGTKTTHIGHMPAETLAKMLLSKLVQEGQA